MTYNYFAGTAMDGVPEFGMSSGELARYTSKLIDFVGLAEYTDLLNRCTERIQGVGHDQYNHGNFQKFEAMELDELWQYLLEELEDAVNYPAMLHIRIRRILEAKDDDLSEEEEAKLVLALVGLQNFMAYIGALHMSLADLGTFTEGVV